MADSRSLEDKHGLTANRSCLLRFGVGSAGDGGDRSEVASRDRHRTQPSVSIVADGSPGFEAIHEHTRQRPNFSLSIGRG